LHAGTFLGFNDAGDELLSHFVSGNGSMKEDSAIAASIRASKIIQKTKMILSLG
jgi:hypothetical protein